MTTIHTMYIDVITQWTVPIMISIFLIILSLIITFLDHGEISVFTVPVGVIISLIPIWLIFAVGAGSRELERDIYLNKNFLNPTDTYLIPIDFAINQILSNMQSEPETDWLVEADKLNNIVQDTLKDIELARRLCLLAFELDIDRNVSRLYDNKMIVPIDIEVVSNFTFQNADRTIARLSEIFSIDTENSSELNTLLDIFNIPSAETSTRQREAINEQILQIYTQELINQHR